MKLKLNCFPILGIYLVLIMSLGAKGDQTIEVWEHPEFKGVSQNYSISHCSNVGHPRLDKLVSSVNLHGNCARFYDDQDCTGKGKDVLPNSPSHEHLGNWNMGDRSRSVGPCRNECAIDVTGYFNRDNIIVQLFSLPNYKGNEETLNGTGCVSVPNRFIDKVKSIKTFGQCIQLYDNPNCANSGRNMTSIELRQDTHFHNEFTKWKFPRVVAMSHCRYKCDEIVKPENNEVRLYDGLNYTGNWIKVGIDKCTNLPSSWESAAKSLQLNKVSCVVIYEDWNCIGDSFIAKYSQILFPTSSGILNSRSLGRCHDSEYSFSEFKVVFISVAVSWLGFVIILVVALYFAIKCGFVRHVTGFDMKSQTQENVENFGMEQLGRSLVEF